MSFTNYEFPNVSAYDSDLRELLKFVNELYDNYNEMYMQFIDIKSQFEEFKKVIDALPDTIKAEVKAQLAPIIDDIIADIEERFSAIRLEIAQIKEEVDGFRAYADALRALSVSDINALRGDIYDRLSKQRVEYLSKIRDIQKDIDDLQWRLPEVYNIVRGVNSPIVKVIYDIYDELRYHALSCIGYDAMGLTCAEFDAKETRVIDFDVRSEWVFKGRCCERVLNPYTGTYGVLNDVLAYMALNYIVPDNLTCGEFDALEIPCEEFDAKEITCYLYDFYGKRELVA